MTAADELLRMMRLAVKKVASAAKNGKSGLNELTKPVGRKKRLGNVQRPPEAWSTNTPRILNTFHFFMLCFAYFLIIEIVIVPSLRKEINNSFFKCYVLLV